jgi:hypothetical protein
MTDRIPPVDPRVDAVLAAAVAPAEAPLPGEEAALRAFREAYPVTARPRRVAALVSASLLGVAVMAGGVAAAAGGLPFGGSRPPVQVPAVPTHGPDRHSPSPLPAANGDAGTQPTADQGGADGDEGRGDAVTGVARTPGAPGRDRGEAVCDTASEGTCESPTPPVEPPTPRSTPSDVSRPDAPATEPAVHPSPAG